MQVAESENVRRKKTRYQIPQEALEPPPEAPRISPRRPTIGKGGNHWILWCQAFSSQSPRGHDPMESRWGPLFCGCWNSTGTPPFYTQSCRHSSQENAPSTSTSPGCVAVVVEAIWLEPVWRQTILRSKICRGTRRCLQCRS